MRVLIALGVACCALSCGRPGPEMTPGDIAALQQSVIICPAGATVEGVDVSAYQPNTNWTQVKNSGRVFAIIKSTEGLGYTNAYFKSDWAQTAQVGIIHGAYHYFHGDEDPTQQANFFVAAINSAGGLKAGDLPPMIDFEQLFSETAATAIANARVFAQRIEQLTGRVPILYTYPNFWDATLGAPAGFDAYPLNIANYGVNCPYTPGPWSNWKIWQWSSTEPVPGIGGSDVDRFNGTLADLQSWTSGASSALPQLTGNDALTVVNWANDGHSEVFGTSPTGELLHAFNSGTTDTWTAGAPLAGGAQCGSAALFWPAPLSYAEVWSPRTTGGTGHLWWTAGTWNGYQDFGGTGLKHFSSLTWPDGHAEVFALGNDGAIWHQFWNTTAKNWSGWATMGGTFATAPAAILWGDGHAELLATDAAGKVWHNGSTAAGWSGWALPEGSAASRPVPIRWPDGHLEVFVRGTDGQLQHSASTATGWAPFSVLGAGTRIVGDPTAIIYPAGTPGAGQPEVFVRDAQGDIQHMWWTPAGGWSAFYVDHPLKAASDPFAWIRSDGKAEVFAVDPAGQLVKSLHDTAGWTPWATIASGYASCEPQAAVDAGTDAGSLPDAGRPDAGGFRDAGTGALDAGTVADGGVGGPQAAGCHCGSASARISGAAWFVGLALLGVAARRKRRLQPRR